MPRIPGGVRTLPDGRVAARVMPADLLDRLAYLGLHADVWMDRASPRETLPATMATAYRTPPPGRVCLVLGAGNASSIGPLDAIHKLFVEQQVVVLKLHPVMAHLAEVQAAALAPLVREGVVRIVHGDARAGRPPRPPPGRGHAPHHRRGPDVRRDRLRDRPRGRRAQAPRRPGAAQAVHARSWAT